MRILQKSRGHYRKNLPSGKTCPFCDLAVFKDQGISELDTKYWKVIACKYPYLDGNLIIIPKRHSEHSDELTPEEWADFPKVLKNCQNALTKLFNTTSFNVGLNIGPESGRSVAHLHWMILPRPSRMRSVPVLEALNDLIVVTVDYKTLKKNIQKLFKKSKKRP